MSTSIYAESSLFSPASESRPVEDWRPLHFFNLYRLVMAGFFVLASYITEFAPAFLGRYNEQLFLGVSILYMSFAIVVSFMIRQRWLPFNVQVLLHGIVDIVVITLLMHTSGGVNSGLGMLLIVAIAGSSILTKGQTAIFFAALASLLILIETIIVEVYAVFQTTSYTQAGILGATFFATAFLAHVLAQRIRASESLARQRGLHLRHLAQLNEQIVHSIRSGILVIDVLGRIRLFNEAAVRLLANNEIADNSSLVNLLPELAARITDWRHNPDENTCLFRPSASEVDIIASFTRLTGAGSASALIMLEDATLTTRRAEQLKLSALGRLTASIAHEIRNPLGAISHAAQLLAESAQLLPSDKRLIEIIVDHCQRVNGIVENVLQLSRQRDAEMRFFDLIDWLNGFIKEFIQAYSLPAQAIVLKTKFSEIIVGFDSTQLHQVLWNLCENALRYSQGMPLLELTVGLNEESRRPYLDVRDHGPGITKESAKQIFEPFFTTERNGTGLGLYIARGICAANQASLHLISHDTNGCCFRLNFTGPA